ncbi:hypothetical protein Q3G72_030006 [Acer saccharum]|nr:hypothetical protein Q3G72_030006 [Acer saccharum]
MASLLSLTSDLPLNLVENHAPGSYEKARLRLASFSPSEFGYVLMLIPHESIVAPHLNYNYDAVCKKEQPMPKPETSKLLQLFRWLFPPRNDDTGSSKVDL